MTNTSSSGYGVLTDEYEDIASSYQSGYALPNGSVLESPAKSGAENALLSGLFLKNKGLYGSLGNVSVSTTDSYNRWYNDGYGDDYEIGMEGSIQEAITTHGTPDMEDTEGECGSGRYSCDDESCCMQREGTVVLSCDVNPSTGETSGTEHTYYSPSFQKKVYGIASTPLVAWNIINLLLSTSLLAFPFAVSQGGFIVLLFILLISLMTNYTSRILIGMMYEKSTLFRKRKIRIRLNYIDLGQDACNSSKGALIVHLIQVLEMLSICVLNVCVLGNLANEIMPNVSIQLCTVIVALLALPTFFVRRLVVIGWMQTIGVFSLAIGLILVEGYCIAYYSAWNFSSIPLYDHKKLPIAIGIIIYAFGIQGVMPGLEEQMRKPKRFGFVINLTFFIAVIVQCLFSVSNAAFYGSKTNQVITIDLENHFALGVATACFIGITILSHFSLPTFVVMEKLESSLRRLFPTCCRLRCENQESRCSKCLSISLRIAVISISLGVAVSLPYFAYLMAFVGSAITVLLSLIVPCWFHLKLKADSLSCLQKAVDVFIILFGLTCSGCGSYFSFLAIYNDYIRHI